MGKITMELVSAKPISLSRAANIISRFAAVDNGSTAAVSMYLERAAGAFNQLHQFHERRFSQKPVDQKLFETTRTDDDDDDDDGMEGRKPNASRKRSKEAIGGEAADGNPNGEEAEAALASSEKKEKKKKKKRRTD